MNTPQSTLYNRRTLLRYGLSGIAIFAGGGCSHNKILDGKIENNEPLSLGNFQSLSSIGELLPADENGLMLPPGFQSRVVAETGVAPLTGSDFIWHEAPDGGATFPTDDGGWIYVSNSEVKRPKGGASALRFNAQAKLIDAYRILDDTHYNCAGGLSPWGTWLSCEESSRGQVYECDPYGIKPAVVRPSLGSFTHEAVAVDTTNQCLYLTEDKSDGGLYRFVSSNGLPDLDLGQLEIASVVEIKGKSYIEWLLVPDPQAIKTNTRNQVPAYQPFAGGEGIGIHQGRVYFTTKYDNRVWCYDTSSHQLDIVYDFATSDNPILKGVDNLTISPAGDILVAEDSGNMQIIVLTTDNQVKPLLQIVGHDSSEITGPAFDPTFKRLYFSSQRGSLGKRSGGITYEISFI